MAESRNTRWRISRKQAAQMCVMVRPSASVSRTRRYRDGCFWHRSHVPALGVGGAVSGDRSVVGDSACGLMQLVEMRGSK